MCEVLSCLGQIVFVGSHGWSITGGIKGGAMRFWRKIVDVEHTSASVSSATQNHGRYDDNKPPMT